MFSDATEYVKCPIFPNQPASTEPGSTRQPQTVTLGNGGLLRGHGRQMPQPGPPKPLPISERGPSATLRTRPAQGSPQTSPGAVPPLPPELRSYTEVLAILTQERKSPKSGVTLPGILAAWSQLGRQIFSCPFCRGRNRAQGAEPTSSKPHGQEGQGQDASPGPPSAANSPCPWGACGPCPAPCLRPLQAPPTAAPATRLRPLRPCPPEPPTLGSAALPGLCPPPLLP